MENIIEYIVGAIFLIIWIMGRKIVKKRTFPKPEPAEGEKAEIEPVFEKAEVEQSILDLLGIEREVPEKIVEEKPVVEPPPVEPAPVIVETRYEAPKEEYETPKTFINTKDELVRAVILKEILDPPKGEREPF